MRISTFLAICSFWFYPSCSPDKDYHNLIKLDDKNFGKYPLVIRVDNSDDVQWNAICNEIRKPDSVHGFEAYVDFLDDPLIQNSSVEKLQERLSKHSSYNRSHSFFFVVDSLAVASPEMPILCISLYPENTSYFRVIPTQLSSIENNLSTANLLYDELYILEDKDGIIRNWDTKKE